MQIQSVFRIEVEGMNFIYTLTNYATCEQPLHECTCAYGNLRVF